MFTALNAPREMYHLENVRTRLSLVRSLPCSTKSNGQALMYIPRRVPSLRSQPHARPRQPRFDPLHLSLFHEKNTARAITERKKKTATEGLPPPPLSSRPRQSLQLWRPPPSRRRWPDLAATSVLDPLFPSAPPPAARVAAVAGPAAHASCGPDAILLSSFFVLLGGESAAIAGLGLVLWYSEYTMI